ncbi:1-acyl-sn-glycerol-3-phosphate acyltransferase [Micromonospora peucetia]|uniref:1-acyl-sn-glycerol-3-phosphate acyltransferase n=1 Tax=Micromonospora peucetia TaxID=47871 RepID=A0A1C6VPK0_9ACTN|nr:1-acyl-sn-glycerol-3-phosphate acyltransferase [Micromonospora peucetia]
MLYWLLKYVILGPLLRLIFRPQVEGLHHVPATGPVILASNHLSFSDSIFTPLIVKRRVTFIAKAEYFTGKGVKGWLTKMFFVGSGTIPVDRSGGRAARAALDTQLRVLRGGGIAGIYPEGTRSPDGRLYRGKTGVARLALESGALVVPTAMLNADEIQPPGKLIPRIARVRIRFGPPLDFSRYAGMTGDRFVERAVTDEIMYELMELSGREYVDTYAQKAKNPPPTPANQSPPEHPRPLPASPLPAPPLPLRPFRTPCPSHPRSARRSCTYGPAFAAFVSISPGRKCKIDARGRACGGEGGGVGTGAWGRACEGGGRG